VSVHEVAAAGFGKEAITYERSRPSYPPDAVAWISGALRLATGRTVCDLAAGTGILTRLLVPTGAIVLAIEPIDAMRTVLREKLPSVAAASAVAESLPFRDAALDAVTIAQAFHWFDAARAFAELRRVLRMRGRVAIVWNARERSEPWVDAVWSIMDRVEKRAPWRDHDGSATRDEHARHERDLHDVAGFGSPNARQFFHTQQLDADGVVARVAGVSHVAVLPDGERAEVLGEVRALLASHPDTRDRAVLSIPYRVDAYWLERTS
jgi:SAM-dependent methyltransferase